MKKLAMAFVLIAISLCGMSQITPYKGSKPFNGSVNQSVGNNVSNNTFATKEAAIAAYYDGTGYPYTPSDLRAYNVNPVDGRTSTRIPLEAFAVAKMPTVHGVRWVIISSGSQCRFALLSNGRPHDFPYALDACGNEILDFEYLPDLNSQQFTAEVPCNNCPPQEIIVDQNPCYNCPPQQVRVQKRPCFNCPPQNNNFQNLNSGKGSLNNYSNRVPSQPYYPAQTYNNERKGWPTWAKVLVPAVALGTASYFIFKKNPADPVDQQVITLPATNGMVGIGLSVKF